MTRKNKRAFAWLSFIIVAIMLLTLALAPTGFYVEQPGEAIPTARLVSAKGRKVPDNFYLVTVSVSQQPATLAEYLWSFTQPHADRVAAASLLSGQTSGQYDELQNWYMETSQQMAVYNAAKAAGKKAHLAYRGVYVMGLQPDSSFKGKLRLGDTIVAVNGRRFRSAAGLISYVAKHPRGSKLRVTVNRAGKDKVYQGKSVPVKGTNRNGIGIQLVERVSVRTSPQIKISGDGIGGPSAGLMFSLTCYQIFTGKNLAPGEKIAGTGTIAADGKVGIIGGADKKVVAASRQGARVFFAPTDMTQVKKKSQTNYAVARRTARSIHSKMKIVPVATFNDAVRYLHQHS